MEKIIKVQGMHCKSCEMLLNDSISEIKDIESVRADFKQGVVTINCNSADTISEVKKIIEKEGYMVVE